MLSGGEIASWNVAEGSEKEPPNAFRHANLSAPACVNIAKPPRSCIFNRPSAIALSRLAVYSASLLLPLRIVD
jgi:hypothetical protein